MRTVAPTMDSVLRMWDCIVVGAGPAGAIAALRLAKLGHEVLLVDKASFPRHKVCGCCLNSVAQEVLAEAGLENLLRSQQAVQLDELQLFDGTRKASIKLPSSYSLSREKFDLSLIDFAVDQGCRFLPNTLMHVSRFDEDFHTIQLAGPGTEAGFARAKVLIVADGLSGRTLDGRDEFKPIVSGKSRFGAGVILDEPPSFYESGKIYMACGSGGYVGLVRLEDGRLDVAAALDPSYSRKASGVAEAAAEILAGCGLPAPSTWKDSHWAGTQVLTRRRDRVAGHRLLIAGDACGYPEPFTGEGIAWALQSGLATANLASKGIREWQPALSAVWQDRYRILRKQQSRSALVARTLRNETTRRLLINSAATFPYIAATAVKYITSVRSAVWQG